MTPIYDKDTRILFNPEGDYRVVQNGENIYGTMGRKDRIVRNRPLPKWIISALERGHWVEILSCEVEGTCPNFYLKIRGKEVTPLVKEEEKEDWENISSETWYSLKKISLYKRTRRYYKDFQEHLSSWEGWKEFSSRFAEGCTVEQWETFKKENPLPPEEENKYDEKLREQVTYQCDEALETCTKKTFDVIKPHRTGFWYTYVLENYCPKIKKTPMPDNYADRWDLKDEKVLKIVEKTKVNEKFEDHQHKYVSNDGMGYRYSITRYVIETYEVTLEDGSKFRTNISKFVGSW